MAGAVEGLYGHVRRNDRRSIALFVGFLVAFQLLAAVALFVPLAIFDEAHAPLYDWQGYFTRYGPILLIGAAVLFALQMLWETKFVRRSAGFHYVDSHDEPRLCRIVEPLAIAAGVRSPYVGVIETPALNAFACGLRRDRAVIVVTRGLIDGLDDEELGSVVAHELMHVRAGDTRLMATCNIFVRNLERLARQGSEIPAFNVQGLVAKAFALAMTILAIALVPVAVPLMLIGGLIVQIGLRIGNASRTLISSSREFVADAEAVRLTQNPAALIAALRRVEGRSYMPALSREQEAMMVDGAADGPLATHPSIADRIAALVRTTGGAALIAPSRRDTREGRGRSAGTEDLSVSTRMTATWQRLARLIAVQSHPGRNLFNLTRRGMAVMVLGAIGFVALNQTAMFRGSALAAMVDMRPLRVISFAGVELGKCEFKTIVGSDLLGCDIERIDRMFEGQEEMDGVIGLTARAMAEEARRREERGDYDLGGGVFSNVAPANIAAAKVREGRCFQRERYAVGDRGLHSVGEKIRGGGSLERFLQGLPTSAADVFAASPTELDAALQSYVERRQTLIEVAHRFYGEPGLRAMLSAYAGPDHQQVVDRLAARMKDARFAASLPPVRRAEYELLVAAQTDFVTCTARFAGTDRRIEKLTD